MVLKGVMNVKMLMSLGRPLTRRKWPLAVVAIAVVGVLAGVLLFAFAASPATATAYAASTVTYNLFATDGYVPLPDGKAIYNYGFVGGRAGTPLTYAKSVTPAAPDGPTGAYGSFTYNGNGTLAAGAPTPTPGVAVGNEKKLAGNAQWPAPLVYATVGDVVQIRFKNLGVVANPDAPNDPHSIHLHGMDVNAANDGVPETSVGAVPANAKVPGAGNVIVYMFSPKYAGTYMYHCHQEADIHVQMGMYGALVIYNQGDAAAATGPGSGKGGTLFGWKYDKDYVQLLSEVDTRQHGDEDGIFTGDYQGGWNPVNYHPQYWQINGLSFPNTIHVGLPGANGWSDWIAAHPGYDPFITGSVSKSHPGTTIPNGDKVLLRMINMGFETQPFHMHGFHAKILGSDQRAWTWANNPLTTPWNKGDEKQTLTIGSGETYEWLVNFGEQSVTSTYPAATQTRYNASGVPVANTDTSKTPITNPDGTPYIAGPVVSGANGLPTPGQLFPMHNHDDYKATNDGVYPGGMFTMLETLP
jgi:manganese oxidase